MMIEQASIDRIEARIAQFTRRIQSGPDLTPTEILRHLCHILEMQVELAHAMNTIP